MKIIHLNRVIRINMYLRIRSISDYNRLLKLREYNLTVNIQDIIYHTHSQNNPFEL